MRINIYSQELTSESVLVTDRQVDTGIVYSAVRLYLHSSKKLHHPPEDDDRSAITFWLPKSQDRRESLARTFENMAQWVRDAPINQGLD